jgi:hypothetical protein
MMSVFVSVCGYLVIILAGLAGVLAYASNRGYQTMDQVWADLPDMGTALTLLLSTLFVVGVVLVWEWYRRASRGE